MQIEDPKRGNYSSCGRLKVGRAKKRGRGREDQLEAKLKK